MDNLTVKAKHKVTNEVCLVLMIDFVNREVYVLPEANLEGQGSQVTWSFDEIQTAIYF